MAPAQKHRQALIDASVALFQRQGYAATGLAEILTESGAPRGSLYHYFPEGKEAIGEAALLAAGGRTEARIRATAAQLQDPRAVVIAIAEATCASMEESAFTRGCPVATVALESGGHSARLSNASRDAFGLWTAALAEMMAAAGIPAARAGELADFILASLEGAMILARVRQTVAPVRSFAAEMIRVLNHELPPNPSSKGDPSHA